jgi:hypothetical protein
MQLSESFDGRLLMQMLKPFAAPNTAAQAYIVARLEEINRRNPASHSAESYERLILGRVLLLEGVETLGFDEPFGELKKAVDQALPEAPSRQSSEAFRAERAKLQQAMQQADEYYAQARATWRRVHKKIQTLR